MKRNPENRIYKCLGCDFVGKEREALDHQCKCDNAMKEIRDNGERLWLI